MKLCLTGLALQDLERTSRATGGGSELHLDGCAAHDPAALRSDRGRGLRLLRAGVPDRVALIQHNAEPVGLHCMVKQYTP